MPIVGVSHTPMVLLRPADMRPVPLGVPIADLAPHAQGTLIVRVNGEFLLRESWISETRAGDVIEFYDVPQDRDILRIGLTLVAVIFLPELLGIMPGTLGALAVQVGSMIAINALLPPTGLQQVSQPGSPRETGKSFSSSLSGNQARLDEPIWKICGRREINPPFASQPYLEYKPKAGESDPNLDNDQYYHALFAIGIGDHEVSVKIGNTPISRFADVLHAVYLPPGTAPTHVLANVTTATEVTSQILNSGQYVGGYAACASQRTCAAIGIDVVATRGLGKGDSALTVAWRVEYRPINDFGQALGSWTILGNESRTAYTSSPQRWSRKYSLGSAARIEVRVVRTDIQDTAPSALHEIAWVGLRAYLVEPALLNPNAAHYEIVMRASDQLSSNASHDVRMIVKGFAQTLDETLARQTATHTRNPMWWLLDLATSDIWGINKPDERIDLQSIYDLAQVADTRQDRFDWCFDSAMNAWDAMQLIARTCRARVFRRNGVISVARDEIADLPVTAFTPRNCLQGMGISETLRQRNSPDGIVIEYQDNRTWEWSPIECPCPGVVTMSNPVIKRIEGITGATHAHREGLYEAANMLYRSRTVSFKTEMQGMLPAYMSPVDFLADIEGYGHSGDVAFWDTDTLTMGLTEPADFSAGPLYLTLIRDDGSLTDPVLVSPGPTEYEIVLPEAPDFTLMLDDGTRERPKYLLGVKDLVKITSITDGGMDEDAQLYTLTGVIDDERVHLADIALLPGPGEIQDLTGEPNEESGGGISIILELLNHTIQMGFTHDIGVPEQLATATYKLANTGKATYTAGITFNETMLNGEYANEWLRFSPVEVAVTSLFEVRATVLVDQVWGTVFPDLVDPAIIPDAHMTQSGSAVNTWLPLGSDQLWTVSIHDGIEIIPGQMGILKLFVEIREIATGIVQTSATIDLILFVAEPPVDTGGFGDGGGDGGDGGDGDGGGDGGGD